jgi:diguanylate cyclase (GGDEF)-like protein/PAS domain S-box-containing protein
MRVAILPVRGTLEAGLQSPSKGFLGLILSAELLTKTFPFYVAFNRAMQLVQVGEAMRRLCPHMEVNTPIAQYFQLRHPLIPLDFAQILQERKALFLLESLTDKQQFKGQILHPDRQDLIFFLGSPWISDSHSLQTLSARFMQPLEPVGDREALPEEYRPPKESMSDFLLLLQARGKTLADTRKLAEHLAKQREDLRREVRQAELATAVLEQAADAVEVTDADSNLVYVNAAFEKLTGYSAEEVMGKAPIQLLCTEPHEKAFYEEINHTLAQGAVWQGTVRGKRKNRSPFQHEVTVFAIRDKHDQIVYYVTLRREATARSAQPEDLGHSLSLLQTTFEATADGILVTNTKGNVLNFNQKFTNLWQIPESALTAWGSVRPLSFVEPLLSEPDRFLSQIAHLYNHPEIESHDILELRDGRILEGRSRPQQMSDMIIGRVWSFRDVTERQNTEAQIRYQATHDLLTGLPNRLMYDEKLAIALAQAAKHEKQLAVMFLDLDRFKLINDTLGHAAGDLLLKAFAKRIAASLREEDTLARWAGDEFTLILPNIHGVDEAIAIAERIMEALKPDFDLEGHTLRVTSSIGIAVYPDHGHDSETLLKNADAALYRVKEAGRNGYSLYNSAINSDASARLTLESHLHRALERQEFALYYQPQVNVITGEILQMEALVRWHHPEMGLIPPSKFIPLAEETGVIIALGEWVLRTACAQNRAWQKAGLPQIRVAVNLSAQQFKQPRLIDLIKQVLLDTDLDPAFLELEITETTVMKNVEVTHTILSEMHEMGISIALDDFGTGYSSLSYLKAFPFHTLKIDRSFVCDVTTDPNDKAIVEAIVAMAKVLNLKLVAEGVETQEQEALLRSLGCEEVQGYLFSRPVTAHEATELLRTNDLRSIKLSAFA